MSFKIAHSFSNNYDVTELFSQGKKGAILTTHSMEEADALCSRVGIMVKGGLRLIQHSFLLRRSTISHVLVSKTMITFRCIGSTQHLKNLYGAGYTLEMKIGQSNQKSTVSSNLTLLMIRLVLSLF